MHHPLKHAVAALASVLVAATTLVAVGSTPAWAICDYENTYYSTPKIGRKVWIPTSTYSDWKRGGTITRTEQDGTSTAKTVGSSHSIGVDGKIGGKIGPIGAEVTVKYNYTHSKSTTTTTTITRGWSYSFNVPTDTLYRARAYKKGWLFKYKKTVTYIGGCSPDVTWRYGAAPVKKNAGVYYWALEKYSNKGKFRFDGL
ncbi:MAG TPA: hypothetical protein VFK41_02090 [Nocardioidaceae bacterium]|nr:hypothetical protein [Nocardioidaceae bacterium]